MALLVEQIGSMPIAHKWLVKSVREKITITQNESSSLQSGWNIKTTFS